MGTKRRVPAEDKARFFAAIAAGSNIREASRIAGIHYNTGTNWMAKSKEAKAKLEVAKLETSKARGSSGGKQYEQYEQDLDEAVNLPPAIPLTRLSANAQRGLEDFDFFRRHYLGRMPSPWQVEAAVRLLMTASLCACADHFIQRFIASSSAWWEAT